MRPACFQIYGQPEPPPELLPLRAGPLTLLYDPGSGLVRRIKLGAREILRGIYAAVRDRNWGTVPAVIQETRREIGIESFHIEFTATHQQAEIDFMWLGRICGTTAGELRYEFNGEARSSFQRNRIGFCVLHPLAECVGVRARQTRVDGRTVECRFPELIEPQIFGRSSFQQLRAVAHEVSPHLWAEVSFAGDSFEMEDQRNWTDASFKTYCTPLTLPFPVVIQSGDRVNQSVELRLTGKSSSPTAIKISPARTDEILLALPDVPNAQLPALGLGTASHGERLTDDELATLRRLKLSHLRADVHLGNPNHRTQLEQWLTEAAALDAKLEVALHLPRTGDAQAKDTFKLLSKHAAQLSRVLALREGEAATSPTTLSWIREHLGKCDVPIGAGSDCNFCELNREHALGRLGLTEADFLFWPINPQVHASDHLSIMETLEAQTATVQSAQAFAAGRKLIISPVTLKQRFNPVATSAESIPNPTELPPQVDARQLSRFAAAWTLGSIASLTSVGVASITYYETTGWRGVMERARGSLRPERFPSTPGELFPVFEVFERLAGFRSCAVIRNPDYPALLALALFSDTSLKQVLAANLSDDVIPVQIQAAHGWRQSFQLEPYALMTLIPPQ